MRTQVSQTKLTEPALLENPSNQTRSSRPFQQYLDEEQKRLALFFSPFSQFNFSSWFEYPSLTSMGRIPSNNINLFSDGELTSSQTTAEKQFSHPMPSQTSEIKPPFIQTNSQNPAPSLQIFLQDLLLKTGWLTPNMGASPLFYQAQLEGKLLTKLDLQFLVDQILSQVKMVQEKGRVELTLGLKPDHLGEILLTLTSRSGMVSIQIQAPEETRKLIEAELKELESALKKAKVRLAEIKVVSAEEVDRHV